jgi:hypothetical protein
MELTWRPAAKILRFGFAILTMVFATLAHAVIEGPAWHFEYAGRTPNKLVWQTESGRDYDLFISDNLVGWTHVDGFPKTGTGGVMEYPFVAAKKGFFKIIPQGPGWMASVVAKFAVGQVYADSPGVVCSIPIPAAATAAGVHSAVHPSVVYFPTGKGGYKYWMAHSPFRSGIQEHEDPCIVASNDGVVWEVPAGVTNPIEPKATRGYHNDPFLYWDAVDQQFVVLWGAVEDVASQWNLYGKTSTDGIKWSEKFKFNSRTVGTEAWGSCALARRSDGTWILWGVNAVPAPNTIIYATAASNALKTGAWTPANVCTFNHAIAEPWHMDIRRYGDEYVMLMCTVDSFGRHQLLFLTSNDGAAWSVDRQFPYAIGWNGDSTFGSNYYKAGFVLGPWFGTGNIGRMWYSNSAFDWIKVTDIAAPPASQLTDSFMASAIDGAIAHASPYVIGDRFARADGNLTGSVAASGQTWAHYITGLQIAGGELRTTTGGNGYLTLGSSDGMVGARFSKLPNAGEFALCCRSKRVGAGATPYQLVLNYTGALYRLQSNTGGAWQVMATWAPAVLGDGSCDGTELLVEFRGKIVKVWMNGRLMAEVTQGQAEYNVLKTQTQVGISITDANTSVDRFFARQ